VTSEEKSLAKGSLEGDGGGGAAAVDEPHAPSLALTIGGGELEGPSLALQLGGGELPHDVHQGLEPDERGSIKIEIPAGLLAEGLPGPLALQLDREAMSETLTGALPPADTEAPQLKLPTGPEFKVRGALWKASNNVDAAKKGSFLGEILVSMGAVTAADVDRALAEQEERGGQLGRILVSFGVCTEEQISKAVFEQVRLRAETGFADVSTAARTNPAAAGLKVLSRPWLTSLVLFGVDAFSLVLAAFLGVVVDFFLADGFVLWRELYVVAPTLLLCLVVYAFLDLYSPLAKSAPDELREMVLGTSLVHAAMFILSVSGNLATRWHLSSKLVWWGATLALVPLVRAIVRGRLSRTGWWGIPVIVLGAAKTGRLIVRTLHSQPRNGLKPVVLLDDDRAKHGTLLASQVNGRDVDVHSINVHAASFLTEASRARLADELLGPDESKVPSPRVVGEDLGEIGSYPPPNAPIDIKTPGQSIPVKSSMWPRGKFAEVEGVPLVGDLSLAPILAKKLKIPYAIVAMPGQPSDTLLSVVERVGGQFSHLLVIPDLFGFATLGVPAKSVGSVLGVEVRQQLLLPWPRLAKRILDVSFTALGGLFVLPFLVIIALLIKLDSKGPIFYMQKRLGRGGKYFKAWKFRTMHGDGEARLKQVLDSDPALREEYEIYHKLRKDPRVTRIGRVLRKYSLDEFPQLWNVINGDMSLVGPRPYIEREIPEMGGNEKLILRATPGMTGMWQVSDRNASSFAWRVQVDVHYVRNWSPWLDIYILAKTVGVVVRGSGV
jgi:lipopolysaccharide/colanic/teichoic acid biosynthesis glycosyltransferase